MTSDDGEEASESGNGLSEQEFRAQLGRSTWRLLHTMAARYPDEPDEEIKERTKKFMELLSYLYPCHQCSTHMQAMFKEFPPKVKQRTYFAKGPMCDVGKFSERVFAMDVPSA